MRAALLLVLLAACSKTAAEVGEEKFNDPGGFSESGLNEMSCATCHTTTAEPPDDRIRPAYSLYGTVAREAWWGGRAARLIDAANSCIVYFLRGDELDPESDAAKQLYEYLLSITPEGSPSDPLPLTLVENIQPIAPGDATAGADVYRRACQYCHGDTHTGAGGFSSFILPESMADYDEILPGESKALILVEVIRHGRFFGVGGVMPFFGTELLSDEQIADLIAYLELE